MRLHRVLVLAIGAAAAGSAATAACTALNPITEHVCGNAIVEPDSGEQCDLFAVDGFTCFDSGARACHIACGDGGVCPVGSGCGADGVCRAPKATYTLAGKAISADVREVSLADFDGDGHLDVVTRGVGATTVHFFDSAGLLSATAPPVSLVRGRATTGKITSDGLASLVAFDTSVIALNNGAFAILGTGTNVWRGQTDRTLSPVLFSSFPIQGSSESRVLAARVVSPSPHSGDDDILVFAQGPWNDAGTVSAVLANFDESKGFQIEYGVPSTVNSIVRGDLPVGRVPQSAPCDSVLVGFKGTTVATTLRACNDAGLANVAPPNTLPLAPPNVTLASAIDGPMFFFDTDGDGLLDVVTGAKGTPNGVQIARGQSDGSFATATSTPVPQLGLPLLAVGHIDQDSALDYVDANGLMLSSGNLRVAATLPLSYAHVGDMNNDGFVDAVGISTAGIDFWVGTGKSLVNHRLYDITNANALAIGDFDGDSNLDLLVGAGSAGTLSVLWGTPGGFPAAPITIGAIAGIQHLATGKLTWFFGDPADAVSSVVIVAQQPEGLVVIPLQGHTDRQITSPFVLNGQGDAGPTVNPLVNPQLPLTGAIGALPADASTTTSLAMLATTPGDGIDGGPVGLRVWSVPAIGNVDTQVFKAIDVTAPPPTSGVTITVASTSSAQGLAMTLVDLDSAKNNGDELVAVVPAAANGTGGSLTIAQLQSGVWQPLAAPLPFTGLARSFGDNIFLPVRVTKADFDADGNDDVLVVYEDTKSTDASVVVDAEIFFGNGAGGFSDTAILADVGAAAPINALGDTTRQLMTAKASGLRLYPLVACDSGAKRCFDDGRVIAGNEKFPDAIDRACGDVNGDGVDDVVVASRATFSVYLGSALIP